PDEGYRFVEWTGDNGTIDDTEVADTTITMEGNHTLTAEFEEIPTYTLTVAIEGEGDVELDPDQEEYEEGTEVELTANPQSSWFFSKWSGDVLEGEEENEVITITMDEDKNLTVHFLQEAFFEVESVDYDEEGSEGGEVVVEYTVTNTGDVEATQTIEITVSDEDDNSIDNDTKEITLSPGEAQTETFTWEKGGIGDFTIKLESDDYTYERSISVSEEEDDTLLSISDMWLVLGTIGGFIGGTLISLGLYSYKHKSKDEGAATQRGRPPKPGRRPSSPQETMKRKKPLLDREGVKREIPDNFLDTQTCPNCGVEHPIDIENCRVCGSPLEDM
ncbi:MAG: InlB B-repeat-containing protein, partial [Candidatus Saliniplasma sp.]